MKPKLDAPLRGHDERPAASAQAGVQNNLISWLTPSRLALLLNLPLILSGLPLGSFDAYYHIFMADHYRLGWFNLLEPRWFGGFSVASYPPLVHQLIALLSMPASAFASLAGGAPNEIRFKGEVVGFSIVLLAVLAWLPIAVQRFALIFVPARAARTAGWLAVGLPSVYLTAYSFGQLPTLAASAALMWALAEGWQYCRTGRRRDLASAVLWAGVTAAAHHAVLLFAVFAGTAAVGKVFFSPQRTQRPPSRKNNFSVASVFSVVNIFTRLLLWVAVAAAFGAIVIWPFITWSWGYTPQTPIDHASRHSLFGDWQMGYFFFWPMYGPLLLALPAMMWWCLRPGATHFQVRRTFRHWPLLLIVLVLFTLGLGGTTPLPQLLFGSNWAWLTYDRFSLWAGLALLPLAGLLYHVYKFKLPCHSREGGNPVGSAFWTPAFAGVTGFQSRKRKFLWDSIFCVALVGFCLFAAGAAKLIGSQPPPVDVETIARLLDEKTKNGERYLTFGFGDQLARLSVLTNARTVDGVYFTARAIPELRQSGLGTLDGAMWNPAGAWAILPFLEKGQAWGVRWALSMHRDYAPPLRASGWELEGEITPGVLLWRNPAPWVSTEWQMPAYANPQAEVWWGLAPLAVLALALLIQQLNLGLLRFGFLGWFDFAHHGFGLLIIIWPFWYYLPLWSRPHPPVYFAYTSGLLFAADGLAAMLVVITFVVIVLTFLMLISPRRRQGREVSKILRVLRVFAVRFFLANLFNPLLLSFTAILLFAGLSIPTSSDPVLSFAFTLHLGAMGLVAWAMAQLARRMNWRSIALPLTIGVLIQAVLGLIEVAVQNTAWLASLSLPWPGDLWAATRGASVVGLANGLRWLRAYGSLPHPNVLGSYLIFTLAGPLLGYIQTGKVRWLWPLLFGAATLFLTFSRAGWLALGVMLISLLMLLPASVASVASARRRGVAAAASVGLLFLALVIAFWPLFWTRVTAAGDSEREVSSTLERLGLAEVALNFTRERPLTGVGAGAFAPAMAAQGVPSAEPVHNVPLLATAETGLGGGAAVIAFGLAILWLAWRRRGTGIPGAILTASLIGLLAISLFDHFAWSLPAGRLLLAVAIGLQNPKHQIPNPNFQT